MPKRMQLVPVLKLLLLILSICAASSLIVSCSRNGCILKDSPVYRIGYQNNVASALIIIADQTRAFERQGVHVEMIPYPSGKLAYQALLRGEIDLCTVSEIPVLTRGSEIEASVIACIAQSRSPAWITANKNAGIRNPTDLVGKRIGTQKHSAVHFFLSTFLHEHDITEDQVNIVFMKAEELPQALASGKIDAFSMRDPFSNEAKKLLPDKIVEFHSSLYLQHFLLVASNAMIQENSNHLTCILKSLITAEPLLTNHHESAKILKEVLPDPNIATISEAFERYVYQIRIDRTLIDTWKFQHLWWNAMEKPLDSNISEIIHYESLESIDPMRVKYLKE